MNTGDEKLTGSDDTPVLAHNEYFSQFDETVVKYCTPNAAMTVFRTTQEVPCNENDKLPRIFRRFNGRRPMERAFTAEELKAMDEQTKYQQVTKGALSFNVNPEAAIRSAIAQDQRIGKEKGGKKKQKIYRRERGCNVCKFDFPAGVGLVTETKHEHLNLLTYVNVDIEEYRDKDYNRRFDYDDEQI